MLRPLKVVGTVNALAATMPDGSAMRFEASCGRIQNIERKQDLTQYKKNNLNGE